MFPYLRNTHIPCWLVSDSLQHEIISAEIKASIKTDHSAITLSINGLDETERGPNFWKFNSNLVNDSDYCELLTTEYVNWLEEFKEVQDKRVLWDLIKYKIRQRTITYSKGKARERRAKLQKVEDKLKECTEKCDIRPNSGNLEELECLQIEYDHLYDYSFRFAPPVSKQNAKKENSHRSIQKNLSLITVPFPLKQRKKMSHI